MNYLSFVGAWHGCGAYGIANNGIPHCDFIWGEVAKRLSVCVEQVLWNGRASSTRVVVDDFLCVVDLAADIVVVYRLLDLVCDVVVDTDTSASSE